MSSRRSTWFYGLLIVLTSAVAGMVLASRLGLTPQSVAQTTFAVPSANSAPLGGPLDATTFRNIAKAASPAVVNIRTESRRQTPSLSDLFGGDDLPFELPIPRGEGPRQRTVEAAGTGFIIDGSGLILTNNHVVENTTKIEVALYGADNGNVYQARIVGRDQLTDSALIELTEKVDHPLPEITFGDSDQMQPGDWVMAIGNPFKFAHSVSVGVVSGLGRPLEVADRRNLDVIQTDAAINPGNSGGPLLNIRGEVIGINTAIIADARQQGNIGIGFAVPINVIRDLLPQLRSGKVTRGRIGVGVRDVRQHEFDELGLKNRDGALIPEVSRGGAAAKAGIEPGDVILTYNGRPVRRSADLIGMVTATRPGTNVPVHIIRDGSERTITVTVEELDLEAERSQVGAADPRDPSAQPEPSRGFGMELGPVTPQDQRELKLESARGALITAVEPDSPAARAGLAPGEVIVRVGRRAVTTAREANDELSRIPSGGTALMRVIRGGNEIFVSVAKD